MSNAKSRLSEEAERVNPIQSVHIWRTPPGSAIDMLVVAHLNAYAVIHQHATAALPNETGGFLIGRVAYDHRDGAWLIEIEEAVPVAPETQDPVHFTFTWRDVDRVRTYREGRGKALVGWFHTHPELDIFLSETDLDRTHRVLFTEPFQVALVYDPMRGRAGYFYWEGAQQIAAEPATWREFDIAVEREPEQDAPLSDSARLDRGCSAPRLSENTASDETGGCQPQSPAITAVTTAKGAGVASGESNHPRARAISADEGTATHPLTRSPRPEPVPSAARPPVAPTGSSPARFPWLLMIVMLMAIACGAMGYFWVFPARGSH